MFRHKGKTRTYKHNLQIASLLSFVAGSVNLTGFLYINRLTTNITGHFAFFIDDMFNLKFAEGIVFLLYIICFLIGSFTTSFIAEAVSRKKPYYIYVIPTVIESIIILFVALWGHSIIQYNFNIIAYLLLFAMGMQNSLVTKISNSIVRTTHLTGLFTDLGIELSQMFFYKENEHKKRLLESIQLRFVIIGFFFLGGFFAGVLYKTMGVKVLSISALLLIFGTVYDYLKLKQILLKRKITTRFRNWDLFSK